MNASATEQDRRNHVVAVAINTFREHNVQVTECLRRVHANLPEATVCVFVNGRRPEHLAIARSFGFQSALVPNYGNNRLWHLWWERMLKWFVMTNTNTFLKLDPDTMVDASPKGIPTADYFGCVHGWFVQGGVTGLSRRLAEQLLAENMLSRSNSLPCPITYNAFADDKYLAATIARLNIRPTPWCEVYSRWRVQVMNNPVEHCIVHPRYYEEV